MKIFVIQLNNEKYFIGGSDNIQETLDSYESGISVPEWISKNGIIETIETFEGDAFDIDKTVIRYMSIHGINSVRGGSYKDSKLSQDEIVLIRGQIHAINNLCKACGLRGHDLDECRTVICYKCGLNNHEAKNCLSQNSIYGDAFNGCTRCGRKEHYAFRCNRSTDIFNRKIGNKCVLM